MPTWIAAMLACTGRTGGGGEPLPGTTTGDSATPEDTGVEDWTPSADFVGMQELFDRNCATCHDPETPMGPRGALVLTEDACAHLVDVPSTNPMYDDAPLVLPGDSGASVLWNKIADTAVYGEAMPPREPLSPEVAQSVRDWIDAGADCEGAGGAP